MDSNVLSRLFVCIYAVESFEDKLRVLIAFGGLKATLIMQEAV
jgi:hypothetical protein